MHPIKDSEGNGNSPDSGERIRDFWDRHGGPAARRSDAGAGAAGTSGWSEVYASDGYTLRCEWSRIGDRREMQYTERPPQASLP
jgi:hypothetical protein